MADVVIFDFDGVIVDSERLGSEVAIELIEQKYAIQVDVEEFHDLAGKGPQRFMAGVLEKHGITDDVSDLLDARLEILKQRADEVMPFPGVLRFIEQLHDQDFRMAIATSGQRERIEAYMKAIGLPLDYFDHIQTFENITHPKPSPEIYEDTVKALDVEKGQCIVVEDSLAGVESAKSAGLICLGVTNTFTDEELMNAGADLVFGSFEDLVISDILAL